MQTLARVVTTALMFVIGAGLTFAGATPALAESPVDDGAVVKVDSLGTIPDYPVLRRGQVVIVNAQRLVVTQEPPPVAQVPEAPPEPLTQAVEGPSAPSPDAIWVEGHWSHGASGFSWVAGRFVAARPGHVFVPPRWAVFEGQFLHFTGFFVPFGVFVRSHFNRFFFSGTPARTAQRVDRGPYWPVGAPTRGGSALTSARARDPYWPVGAPTRANSPFNRVTAPSAFRPVGLRR